MSQTKIEWTDTVWNPVTGCTKISKGCKNCYAETMTRRLKAMGQEKYAQGFNKVVCHPNELQRPYTWTTPKKVFVNSMSDLFHEQVPTEFIRDVFRVMNDLPQHQFQILTKRPRLAMWTTQLRWTPNIWMGVSVENEAVMDRVAYLRQIPAGTRFLSCEPLLGPLDHLDLSGIHWVIVGGESGPKARAMQRDWALSIKNACEKAQVPFFFKQWGGKNKKAAGALLDGVLYQQYPT